MDTSHDPAGEDQHQGANLDRPAWTSPVAWATLLVVLVIGLWLDLGSKSWAFKSVANNPVELNYQEVVSGSFHPPWHEGVKVLPGDLLDFHLVLNRGAVFGIGQGSRGIFVGFTIVAVTVAIGVFGWWTRASAHLAHVAIALILAGGIGNLYDRVFIGAVRDFLHMLPRWDLPWGMHWPGGSSEVFPWVFNVADVMLLVGMGLLLVHVKLADRAERAAKEAAA